MKRKQREMLFAATTLSSLGGVFVASSFTAPILAAKFVLLVVGVVAHVISALLVSKVVA